MKRQMLMILFVWIGTGMDYVFSQERSYHYDEFFDITSIPVYRRMSISSPSISSLCITNEAIVKNVISDSEQKVWYEITFSGNTGWVEGSIYSKRKYFYVGEYGVKLYADLNTNKILMDLTVGEKLIFMNITNDSFGKTWLYVDSQRVHKNRRLGTIKGWVEARFLANSFMFKPVKNHLNIFFIITYPDWTMYYRINANGSFNAWRDIDPRSNIINGQVTRFDRLISLEFLDILYLDSNGTYCATGTPDYSIITDQSKYPMIFSSNMQ